MPPDERPLLIPCLALCAGIALSDFHGISPPAWGMAALLSCLILSCAVRHRLLLDVCTLCFFLAWGMFSLPRRTCPPSSSHAVRNVAGTEPRTVEGIVRSRPVTRVTAAGSGSSFILDVTGIVEGGRLRKGEGGLMVFVRSGEVGVSRGDLARLTATVSVPRPLGLPGEFDFGRHLALLGVSAVASLPEADGVVLMRGGVRYRLLAGIDRRARRLGELIRSRLPDEGSAAVLVALLIGEQKRIPPELADAYTRAGVSHILSISGFHVGILAYFVAQTLLLIGVRWEWLALRLNLRQGALLPTLPAMLFYLFLTGAAPATARSVIMLAIFVLALYLERESDPINALLLSALLLLALNPAILFDVSFQLSFLSLWGMTVMVPAAMKLFSPVRRSWLRSLVQFTAASCAAAAATAVPLLSSSGRSPSTASCSTS